MSKTLIIAEKPSVASDIAKALGGFKKEKEYFEGDEYVVTSAVGHLLQLCLPNELDKKRGKWSFDSLPVIPPKFELKPIERSESRLKVVQKLLKRKDITKLINACDAGREGELIFRYIVQFTNSTKPIQRLWLQSMTPDAIREGFQKLKSDDEMLPLADAAVCRSESDWLVGINGTRALTALNSKGGGFFLTPVGRVQTPTLAMVVDRELKIKNFQSRNYWELHGTFLCESGSYVGRWFDEKFQKLDKEEDGDKKAERIWDHQKAEGIRNLCGGKSGVVTEEKKPATQLSPLLFDLTSLQREANSKFGLSAKRTLQIAQTLYERHKVLTYPRTDSRYLPEDYIPTVKAIMKTHSSGALGKFAERALKEGLVHPSKRIFNNEKVSDHFAIIPTKESPDKLDEFERKVYDLVFKRFLAVFYPAAVFEVTNRITRVEGEPFKTEGKVMKDPGWMAIYGRDELSPDEAAQLVAVKEGEKVKTEEVELRGLETRPPARFSEATLLSAMEGAGKLIEDEELRDAMGKRGLGTPATRAATIEGLIAEAYLLREGRELSATPKAISLFDLLKAVHIESLSSPEMTGEWEFKLKQMEEGQVTRDQFMKEIVGQAIQIVDRAKNFEDDGSHAKPFSGKSPVDGAEMIETLRYYQTKDGVFRINKVIAGRFISSEEANDLLKNRSLPLLQGFRSKMGRPFAAALKMNAENKIEFVFEGGEGENREKPTIVNPESLGKCPLDGSEVFETVAAYYCENGIADKPTCKFRIGKVILSQEISRDQVRKILTEGKTDLLRGFVSQRTKRKFSAYLVLQKEGKVSFEFEPRTGKGKPPLKKTGEEGEKGEEETKIEAKDKESKGKKPFKRTSKKDK
jgi:DNA topoisomerase-3